MRSAGCNDWTICCVVAVGSLEKLEAILPPKSGRNTGFVPKHLTDRCAHLAKWPNGIL